MSSTRVSRGGVALAWAPRAPHTLRIGVETQRLDLCWRQLLGEAEQLSARLHRAPICSAVRLSHQQTEGGAHDPGVGLQGSEVGRKDHQMQSHLLRLEAHRVYAGL